MIVQRPDNRAALHECVAVHVRPATRPQQLEWQPPYGRLRVHLNTCERCAKVSYEFASIGGAYVVRRTDRTSVRNPVVQQTVPMRYAVAWEWWLLLVNGRAV